MVRALLILAALALSSCADAPREHAAGREDRVATTGSAKGDAHAGLACAACHRGNRADVGRASVPRESCTASGCHKDAGPPEVTLASARFEHRNHGVQGDIALNCAGCHTHSEGDKPLIASLDACALCHRENLAERKDNECRLCHRQLTHQSLTSQGIPVAHGSLPWLETGCSRCHYDVLASEEKVALETCTKCHTRTSDVTKRGIAQDLHPSHRGIGCTSCHEQGLHRIGAMSSAVDLKCADCHSSAHEQRVTAQLAVSCSKCHADSHRAQQRMVLGFVGDEPVLPSAKFMMGMTCRSCHVPPGATEAATSRRGQAAACLACHEPEYTKVLNWWIQGASDRERGVSAYVKRAKRDLSSGSDTVQTLLTSAESMLAAVRAAGGHHNLELSDRIFRTSVNDALNAYKLSGRMAPIPPELGNTPHLGTCSFCHYSGNQKLNYGAIRPELHERLIKTRR